MPSEALGWHYELDRRVAERPLGQGRKKLTLEGSRAVNRGHRAWGDNTHSLRGTDSAHNFKRSSGQLMTESQPSSVDVDSWLRRLRDAGDE